MDRSGAHAPLRSAAGQAVPVKGGAGVLAAAALVAAFAGPARADTAAPDTEPSPKREVPDYAGRGPEPTTAGDVALWVPRVVLSPLYFVSEFVLRRPIGLVVTEAERVDLPRKAYNFFTFGPEHKAGIVPVGFYDFDFLPSVGFYTWWNDAGMEGSHLSAHFEMWPTNWWAGNVTERLRIDSTQMIRMRVEGSVRPDRVFYGLGPKSLQSDQSRYGRDRVEVGGSYEWRFWRASRLQLGAWFHSDRTRPGDFGGDPSLERQAAAGAFAVPYGFDRTDAVPYGRVGVAIDSRNAWSSESAQAPDGSGARIELQAEPGGDLRSPTSAWIKYRANVGAFLDLNGYGRIVSLSATTMYADSLTSQAIPFTELITLGGDGAMRAYFTGRLVDTSSFTSTARYLWPIGPWLAGTIQASVGNVFDGYLQGFQPDLLRFSGSIGVSTKAVSDYPVEFVFGVGSETFQQGGKIDAFRVTFSANHGGF